MSVLDIILCTLVISLCMSIIVGAVFYHKLNKKHEEELRTLHNLFRANLERQIFLEEEFFKHMKKYH
jgi:hypothetical protein